MALCYNCGTGEDEMPSDDNGMCRNCRADNWIQWEDFFVRKGLLYGDLDLNFWKAIISQFNTKDMIGLMIRVLKSESMHYTKYDAISWIFQYKIGKGIIEAFNVK